MNHKFLICDTNFIEEYLNHNDFILLKYNKLNNYNFIVINDIENLSYLNIFDENCYLIGNIDDLIIDSNLKDYFLSNKCGILIQKIKNRYISSITLNEYLLTQNDIKIDYYDFPIISSIGNTINDSINNLSSQKNLTLVK